MAKIMISIIIDNDVWIAFRKKLAKEKGLDKGIISQTIEDLIREYNSK